LVQVTVVPTATINGFVPNAVAVRVLAPLGIDTAADAPVAVDGGVVDGVGLGDEEPLHPATAARTAMSRIERNAICLPYGSISAAEDVSQMDCRSYV
jgi:hypothetical protein